MAYFKLRNHYLHTSGRALLWVLGHVSHGQRRSRRRCRVLEGKHPAGERHLRYEIMQAAGHAALYLQHYSVWKPRCGEP